MRTETKTETALERDIRNALDEIHDPCSVSMSMPMGLGEMGLVKDLHISPEGHVDITLRLTSPFCEMVPFMRGEAIRRVEALDGVTAVEVRHDSGLDWDHDLMSPAAQERRRRRLDVLRRATEAHRRELGENNGNR